MNFCEFILWLVSASSRNLEMKPTKKELAFLKSENPNFWFLRRVVFSFEAPFRPYETCSDRVEEFSGFLKEEFVEESVHRNVKTTTTYTRITNDRFRVRTKWSFQTEYIVIFCLDSSTNLLHALIVKFDNWGNLCLDERFSNENLTQSLENLSDGEIEESLRSYLLKIRDFFERAHEVAFNESEEELDWHGYHNDAYHLENDGFYHEDPDNIDDFSVFDVCPRKSGSSNRQRKRKSEKNQRF
jgi:hypothetical protein